MPAITAIIRRSMRDMQRHQPADPQILYLKSRLSSIESTSAHFTLIFIATGYRLTPTRPRRPLTNISDWAPICEVIYTGRAARPPPRSGRVRTSFL